MTGDENKNHKLNELKIKRESLGLSLKDIFHRTRININYLQAIENEEFNLLPEPVYTKNFIKTYARALGIDAKDLIARYDAYLESLKILDDAVLREGEESESFLRDVVDRYRGFLTIILIATAITAVFWLVSAQYRSVQKARDERASLQERITIASDEEQSREEEKTSFVRPDSTKALHAAQSEGSETSVGTDGAALPADQKGSRILEGERPAFDDERETDLLVIQAVEETWLKIKIDQEPSFQIVLKPGQKAQYRASAVDMDIGNAGGVVIRFKGKKVENLGPSGQAIHLRLP